MDLKLQNELKESTLIRGRQYLKAYDMRDILDFTFLYMLSLQILRDESFIERYVYNTTRLDTDYAKYKQQGNDLYQLLHLLLGEDGTGHYLKKSKSSERLKELKSPNKKDINWFLNQVRHERPDNMSAENRMMINLEQDLMIKNSDYRSIRRMVRDWDKIDDTKKKKVLEQLTKAFRTRLPKAEIRKELDAYAKTLNQDKKLTETIQLNELRDYIDVTKYGGWISPNKELHYVQTAGHYRWAGNNIPYESPDNLSVYENAFALGWIRFEYNHRNTALSIQGSAAGVKSAMPIWWPTIINENANLFIDTGVPSNILQPFRLGVRSANSLRNDILSFLKDDKKITETKLLEYNQDALLKLYKDKLTTRFKTDLGELNPGQIFDLLDQIEEADPTPNGKYMTWIVRSYVKGDIKRFEDIQSRIGPALTKYMKLGFKKKLKPEHKDINQIKDIEDVVAEYEQVTTKRGMAQAFFDEGEAKLLHKDNDLTILIPQTEEASCYFGQGTKWCTASTDARNYFDTYNKQGPMMIVIYKGEKFQLHNESKQYMDAADREMSMWEIKDLAEVHEIIAKYLDLKILDEKKGTYIFKGIYYDGNDEKHRLDGPAVTKPDGSTFWYLNGNPHRDNNLPSHEWANGTKHWNINGLQHRTDGGPTEVIPREDNKNIISTTIYHNKGKMWRKTTNHYTGELMIDEYFKNRKNTRLMDQHK